MSIPFFFVPMQVDGRRVFDGGLRNNFPLKRFLDDFPNSHFIALYLGKPNHRLKSWIGSELLDIIVDGEERQTVDANREHVVVIDPSPIAKPETTPRILEITPRILETELKIPKPRLKIPEPPSEFPKPRLEISKRLPEGMNERRQAIDLRRFFHFDNR